MKDRNEQIPKEIRLPELKIHAVLEKIIGLISRIHPFYWLISIIVFLAILLALTPYHIWIDIWDGLKTQAILVYMLIFFSLLAVSLVWSAGQRIDEWVLLYFNMYGKRAPWLDWLMLGVTQIGNGIFAMVLALIVFLSVDHLLAFELAIGTLILWLVVELLKVIFRRARPYTKLNNIRIIGSRAGGYSFPSGHTSQTFFLVSLMLHYYNSDLRVSLVIYTISVLVGITRIYVGMHYPRDVIGGAILGTSFGILGIVINSYIFG